MIVTHKIKMDLAQKDSTPCVTLMQGDTNSRRVQFRLLEHGAAFPIPEDCTVLVRYEAADGTGGAYDTLPDGTQAWELGDNTVTVAIVPQVCAAAGDVYLTVTLLRDGERLSCFSLRLCVLPVKQGRRRGGEYVSVTSFLPQTESAAVGDYLRVAAVDAAGHVTAWESVEAEPGTGITSIEIELAGADDSDSEGSCTCSGGSGVTNVTITEV